MPCWNDSRPIRRPSKAVVLMTIMAALWLVVSPPGILQAQNVNAQLQDIDDQALKAAGIRTLRGKYVTLFTDLPAAPDVDNLAQMFDAAIPQWARFFGTQKSTFDGWQVQACVIRDKQRFQDYGLLPVDLPPFLNGFQMFNRIWIYEQPGPYYRRHLVLHEGTHAATNRVFGRVGPAWYREGIAELLGTHQLVDGKLVMGVFPADKKLVEHWGRIRIIKDELAEGKSMSIPEIVNLQARDFLNVEAYAWSWALQTFGHRHPKFAPLFNQLRTEMYLSTHGVSARFMRGYEANRLEFEIAWQVFLSQLDYGYDSSTETISNAPRNSAFGDAIETRQLQVDRGWQSTGLRVPPDTNIEIAARSQFQLAEEPAKRSGNKVLPSRPWISEPQGVTIEYYQQRPLGMLLAAVVNPDTLDASSLARPTPIGRRGVINSGTGGVLYLRINERTDRMGDNKGKITVNMRKQPLPTAPKPTGRGDARAIE